jgi:hypothetical protein
MRNVWMLWSNVWMHWSKPDTRTRGTCVPEGRSASGRLFLVNERRETTRIEATTCTVASPRPVLTVTPTCLKEWNAHGAHAKKRVAIPGVARGLELPGARRKDLRPARRGARAEKRAAHPLCYLTLKRVFRRT